jgi:hypothetical protein
VGLVTIKSPRIYQSGADRCLATAALIAGYQIDLPDRDFSLSRPEREGILRHSQNYAGMVCVKCSGGADSSHVSGSLPSGVTKRNTTLPLTRRINSH